MWVLLSSRPSPRHLPGWDWESVNAIEKTPRQEGSSEPNFGVFATVAQLVDQRIRNAWVLSYFTEKLTPFLMACVPNLRVPNIIFSLFSGIIIPNQTWEDSFKCILFDYPNKCIIRKAN